MCTGAGVKEMTGKSAVVNHADRSDGRQLHLRQQLAHVWNSGMRELKTTKHYK